MICTEVLGLGGKEKLLAIHTDAMEPGATCLHDITCGHAMVCCKHAKVENVDAFASAGFHIVQRPGPDWHCQGSHQCDADKA